MATIVTRSGKGSPLTNAEVDGNFTNLNTELATKLNTSSLATVATTGAYSDLTGKPTNVSSFSNDSGYITGITSSNVTTALGFTPYNATNPAGYITSSALSGYLPLAGGTIIGNLTVNNTIAATTLNALQLNNNTGGTGFVTIDQGGASYTGYLGFWNAAGVRQAYVGFAPSGGGQFSFSAEGSTGFEFNKVVYANGGVTAAVDVRAPIFYDQNNTAYYVDPNGTSNIGGLTVTNTITGSVSGNAATATNISNTGTVTLASATESNSIYATAPSYTADQPTKLLNFDWYGNVFSLGNIRSGSTPSSGFGVYYTPSGGSRAELMRVDTSGNVLINRTSASGIGKLNVEGGVDVTSANVTVQAGYGIAWRGDQSRIMTPDDNSYGALIRWGATGGCRLFESTTERLRIDGTGSVRAFVDFRAPIFYDSNDTAYYVDGASSSSLSSLLIGYNGSTLAYNDGATGKLYFGSLGGDAPTNYHITTNMENVGGNYSKLDFKWYTGQRFYTHYAYGGVRFKEITTGNTLFSVGEGDLNVRAENILYSGNSVRSPIFYDLNDTAYYIDPASGSNLTGQVQITGGTTMSGGWNRALYLASNFPVIVMNSYNAKYSGIGVDYSEAQSGMVFWVNGNSADITNGSATAALRINTGNFVQAAGSFRAPIFYDIDDSNRYLDPSSTSVLTTVEAYNGSGFRSFAGSSSSVSSQIYFGNANNSRAWNWQVDENNLAALWGYDGSGWAKTLTIAQRGAGVYLRNSSGADILAFSASTFGYSSAYRTLVVGNQAYTTVCIGVDPVANASGSFNGAGSGVEVMFKNGVNFISPNSANNSYNNYLQLVDGIVVVTNYLQATSSLRAPLFYDSDNTSYFVDPTSTSRLSVANVNFMTLLNDEGLNVKGIRGQFAAGSDGQGISLFSNVDIGYPSGWGSGLGNTPSRGLSVYGGLRVAYSGDGFITSDTSVRSPIFYDSNNTGYYVDPASTSIQYRINVLNGINLTGGIALTSSGATLDNSIAMRLTENYGALWNGGDGTLWHHQVINASMLCGFTGAGANWGSGRVVASNDVRGTLFYDYNNTAYYVDPNSTSVLNNLSVNGGAVYRSDWTTRFQSPSDFVDGTLVTTDIPATGFAGDSFVIEITGKTYDQNNPPVKVVAQGYLYNDTIINYSGISYAGNFASYVKVFQDGGVLKFWWPRISYWNSFNVNVMSMDGQTNGTITRNRVTAIGNSTEPTGTKKVQINLTKTLKTGDAAGSISGFNNPTTAPTANTIAYRDAAGDISAREIVLSSGLSTATPTVLVSMFPTTNQMVRTTPAAVAASIQSSIQTLGNFNVVTGATECGIRFRGAALDFVGRFSDYMSVYNQTSGGEIKLFNSGFFNCNQYGVNEASWRAPIFYDSNDTNYYLDPASTSRINQINYTALYSASSSDYGIVGNNGYFDTVNSGVDADALELCYVRGSEVRIGTGGGNKAIRASIFYEGTDTAYYLDPNGGTSLRTVGDWRSDSGAWTGEFNGKIQYHANNWYFQSANTWEFRRSDSANAFSVSQAGAAEARNDFRAPIFYDNYNTGYYVDPNSTSNLVGLTVGNRINGSISGDAQRLFNHTGANNDGLQYWNTTGNDTLNPNTGWHYAIRMGHGDADTYYSATIAVDFFNDNVWLRRKGGGANQPWKRFALYDNVYEAILYASSFSDANNTAFFLDPNNTGTSLNVAGSIVAAGNVTAYSDRRLKNNIQQMTSALDKVSQLLGVTFTRNDLADTTRRYGGLLAQDVEKVLPEAVHDIGGTLGVDYNATIGLLVEAIKELHTEVEMLRK